MSLDINELVRLVKQAAVEAVRADAPMAVCYGTVLSTTPLKIQVDQKKILGTAQLILTDAVRDYNVIGKPKDYAMSEMKRRITEALLQDDRITSLSDWEFEPGRKSVRASFVVHTIYGDVEASKEVDI